MFNNQVGVINRNLEALFGIAPAWTVDPWLAKAAILIVNLLPQSTNCWSHLLESFLLFVDALLMVVEIIIEPVLSFVLVRL